MRHVLLVAEASEDLEAARDFYNQRERGIGDYCVDSLLTDIESLSLYHGIHPVWLSPDACEPISVRNLLSGFGRDDDCGGSPGLAPQAGLDSKTGNGPVQVSGSL